METDSGEREGGRKSGVRTKETTWVRAATRYNRATASTLLARRIARLPRRIPAPTVLLRAKWLIIIIIILYFLRSSETTEKQKAHEININKSSGHRTYRRTDERYPKMERANGRVEKGGSRQGEGWREKRKTHISEKTDQGRGKEGGGGERTDAKVVGCIVARFEIPDQYSWPG